MLILKLIWLFINIILIILILVRSPNEQSLQEIIGPLKFIDSYSNAEKTLDRLIQIFVIFYFGLSFFLIAATL
jgi:preprotein translocase subunit SecG